MQIYECIFPAFIELLCKSGERKGKGENKIESQREKGEREINRKKRDVDGEKNREKEKKRENESEGGRQRNIEKAILE